MKRFLKKKWHGIPIGITTAILVVCLLAGSALAAYTLITGTGKVTVGEPITFGVNYVGWKSSDATGDPMKYGYYRQSSPFTFSVALMAGESSHGNPDVPEAVRDLMPMLTVGDIPAVGPCPWPGLHTFNSMMVENTAGVPITVTFTVLGESAKVYMVSWEGGVVSPLNGYTIDVPADGFAMRGIGVVAETDATPGNYSFTISITRG